MLEGGRGEGGKAAGQRVGWRHRVEEEGNVVEAEEKEDKGRSRAVVQECSEIVIVLNCIIKIA